MPLYEYKCHKCGNEVDLQLKLADSDSVIHCKCGEIMEKQLSAPAVFFNCKMPTGTRKDLHTCSYKGKRCEP